MTKRLTLPLKTAATYNPKTDTVVLTSDDPVLGKNRFRVNLRRNTVEDRTLRQLILSEENLAAAAEAPTGPTPPPLVSTLTKGHLPLGVSHDGEQVMWNPDRDPHLLIGAKDYRARARVTSMLLATARARSEEWEVADFTESPETISDLHYTHMSGRAGQMRQEGVAWYQEMEEPHKKLLVFIDAAETLSEKEANTMRKIMLLGPALGIQVVAVVADRPDWYGQANSLFGARLMVGEPAKTRGEFSNSQTVVSGNYAEFSQTPPMGENAAIFGTSEGTYHRLRFHSMPRPSK